MVLIFKNKLELKAKKNVKRLKSMYECERSKQRKYGVEFQGFIAE